MLNPKVRTSTSHLGGCPRIGFFVQAKARGEEKPEAYVGTVLPLRSRFYSFATAKQGRIFPSRATQALTKKTFSDGLLASGQAAIEYMLLLAVVVLIVLIGFKIYLPNIYDASDLYFNKATNAIMDDKKPTGT